MTKETSWLVPTLILPRDKVIVKQGATVSCYLGDKCASRTFLPSYTLYLHPLTYRSTTQGNVRRLRFSSRVLPTTEKKTKKTPTIATLTALSEGVRRDSVNNIFSGQ